MTKIHNEEEWTNYTKDLDLVGKNTYHIKTVHLSNQIPRTYPCNVESEGPYKHPDGFYYYTHKFCY